MIEEKTLIMSFCIRFMNYLFQYIRTHFKLTADAMLKQYGNIMVERGLIKALKLICC